MESNILSITKQMLGIPEEDECFNAELIVYINSVLLILNQLGVGVKDFLVITGEETWNQFLSNGPISLEMAKLYMYLRVRLLFDQPQSSVAIESMNKAISELEYRMCMVNEL